MKIIQSASVIFGSLFLVTSAHAGITNIHSSSYAAFMSNDLSTVLDSRQDAQSKVYFTTGAIDPFATQVEINEGVSWAKTFHHVKGNIDSETSGSINETLRFHTVSATPEPVTILLGVGAVADFICKRRK